MRRKNQENCITGDCDHRLKLPSDYQFRRGSVQEPFYAAQLNAAQNYSETQEKAIKLAPEL